MPFDGRCTTVNFSYIYYKQREKPGPEGVLEKKFSKALLGFLADFGRFAHILGISDLLDLSR